MKPYLWMTDYTPQEEWIDHQGVLLWLAFFFTEIGAGLYLVSLFFGLWGGCLTGWILSPIVGGGLHMLYLGKPMRAWRAILRPGKSELSRGLIIMSLFTIFGAIQIAPSLGPLSALPWQSDMVFFKVVMTILGFFVITHGFMTMNVMSSIPFWNSSILPVLSLASGIWLGTQLAMGGSIGSMEQETLLSMELLARWSLFAYAFLVGFYLWNANHASLAVKESLRVILKGDLALPFYIGVVLLGLIIPIVISLKFWAGDMSSGQGLVYLRIICAFIGDLTLRYLISKSGRYSPLIYSNIVRG
jgi:formate-dependent nitrite reductase membrane component NrfD